MVNIKTKRSAIVGMDNTIKRLAEGTGYPSGTITVRKILKPFQEEIKDWKQAREDFITKNGKKDEKTGTISISSTDQETIIKYLEWENKELNEEVSFEIKNTLTEDDLNCVELSPKDIDLLVEVGLFIDDEDGTEKTIEEKKEKDNE